MSFGTHRSGSSHAPRRITNNMSSNGKASFCRLGGLTLLVAVLTLVGFQASLIYLFIRADHGQKRNGNNNSNQVEYPSQRMQIPLNKTRIHSVREMWHQEKEKEVGERSQRKAGEPHFQFRYEDSNPSRNLPEWITNYLQWHQTMRKQFPGRNILEDPNAPKLLIRSCWGICGGLNDRLGQLPWDLYLANQTGRFLMIHWYRPVPLQYFLLPNELDWTVPNTSSDFFPQQKGAFRLERSEMLEKRHLYKDLFQDFSGDRPDEEFWSNRHLEMALERAVSGAFKDERILRHRFLGHLHEDELETRLAALGEENALRPESFGAIFFMFFQPSAPVQNEFETVIQGLGLRPFEYAGVHCRVRHPKATKAGTIVHGKAPDYAADKTGLPWEGETRKFAIETATKALQCAKTLVNINDQQQQQESEPIYFFSDSNDLVRYMAHELMDPQFVAGNATLLQSTFEDRAARDVIQQYPHVIARDMSKVNAHLDKQKGMDPPAYFGTFVDLLLAIHARCVTYGIGYYAVFATKISGISCQLLYQEEVWGGNRLKGNVQRCKL